MCMHDLSLNLKRVNGEFIGTGYKVMYTQDGDKLLKKGWMKSKCWQGTYGKEHTNTYKVYYPGFHIWTNLEDAKRYLDNSTYRSMYEVSFAEVVGFGTNVCNGLYKPCVVTNWIKYNKKI